MSEVVALVLVFLGLFAAARRHHHDDSSRFPACATLLAAMADAPQAQPAPNTPGTPAAWTLAGIARLGALGVGIVYTIGVLIVNLHLGQYGIMSLDLARPEYVMAGLLWLFLTSVAVLSIHASVNHVKRHWTATPRRWVQAIFGVVFGLSIPLGALAGLGYRPVDDAPEWVTFAGGLLVIGTGAVLYVVADVGMALTKDPARLLVPAVPHLQGLVNTVILLLVGLGLYAAVVYPDLPREYGGGRRATVEIVLSDVPPIDWKAGGIEFRAQEKTIGPVMVLLDTLGSLIVIRPETWKERRFFRVATSARVLALDRKLVSAVVYLPKGGGVQGQKK